MTWSISTRHMPSIGSYAKAKDVYEKTKPWRNGRSETERPLGQRYDRNKCIKLNARGGYELILHHTAVVTYYEHAVELRCWDSISTRAFAWCVAPDGISVTSFSGQMFWKVNTPDGEHYYRTQGDALILEAEGKKWRLTNEAAPIHEWAYNPKLGAEVRKKLKNYRVWHEMTSRVGGVEFPKSPPARFNVSRLLSVPDDVDAFLALAKDGGQPDRVLKLAYEISGARYKRPVPPDRLPRTYA